MSLYWQSILSLAAINGTAAWGLSIAVRSGQLSVGHAAFAGVGAYAGGVLTRDVGLPFLLALPVGFVVGGALGLAFRALFLRLDHLLFAIATLIFGQVAAIAAGNFFIPRLGGEVGLTGLDLRISPLTAVIILGAALVIELFVLRGSAFDLRLRLGAEDADLVALSGAPPAKVQVLAFGLSTAVLGLTGVLWAHLYGTVQPGDLQFGRSFDLLVFAIVGGAYSGYGAMFGGVALSLLPYTWSVIENNRRLTLGIVLLVVVVFRRGGLFQGKPVPILDRLIGRRVSVPPAGAD
jgi:branched-chain amino acid transport system permease protein